MTTDELILCLECAADDAARLELLEGFTPDEQQRVHATIAYRELMAQLDVELTAERRAFAAFTASLEAADDAEKRRLIEAAAADPARGPAFLSEWQWDRVATAKDAWLRLSAML